MTPTDTPSAGVAPLLVLGKITEILDAFTLERPELTLRQIREATGFPASTVQRLVANMVWAGLLEREDDRLRVGLRMAYWAAPAVAAIDAIAALIPIMEELRELTGESVSLFRAEQDHRVCVALRHTRHELRQEAYVGKIMPLHAGSAGRVLLAWNPGLAARVLSHDVDRLTGLTITVREALHEAIAQCRQEGYAVSSGERIAGAAGLSAPVFDTDARALFSLTISGPSIRFTADAVDAWLPHLIDAGRTATRQIGGRPPRKTVPA